jgi:hypothetical protein
LTNQEQFFDKLGEEYDAFIDDLRGRSADEIINASYKKVVFDELVAAFGGVDYTERDYAVFNRQDNLLASLYHAWLDTDTADFEQLPNLFERFAEREMGYKLEYRDEYEASERGGSEIADKPEREATWTDAINGRIECFSTVIAIGDSDYPYFVGEVNAVKEYPGEHKPDGVFVEFNSEEYSEERKREIEAHFESKNGYFTAFDKLDLYNVLIPSNQLIAVPERDLPALLVSRSAAEAYCNAILAQATNHDYALENGIADDNRAAKPAKQPAKPKLPRAADNEPKSQSLTAQLDAATAEANERNATITPQTQHKSNNKEID